jgi:hypothetical protein
MCDYRLLPAYRPGAWRSTPANSKQRCRPRKQTGDRGPAAGWVSAQERGPVWIAQAIPRGSRSRDAPPRPAALLVSCVLQRQRPQNLTSASGDAIWGAHRPNYTHGQFGGIFFCPPGTPAPPVHPRGNFYQTDFPPLSCSVLRGPALLRPHPSGARAGLTPAGLHPQEVLPGRLPDKAHSNWQKGARGTKQASHEEGPATR